MSKNSRGFCSACLRDHLRCNRGKPKCDKCNERGTKCGYSFELQWGGRQYKDMKRSSGIPNTKFYKGALLIKDKTLIAGKRTRKARQFLQFGKEENNLSLLFDKEYKDPTEGQQQPKPQREASAFSEITSVPPKSESEDVIPLVTTFPKQIAPDLLNLAFGEGS